MLPLTSDLLIILKLLHPPGLSQQERREAWGSEGETKSVPVELLLCSKPTSASIIPIYLWSQWNQSNYINAKVDAVSQLPVLKSEYVSFQNFYAAMRMKTHFDNVLYLSSLLSVCRRSLSLEKRQLVIKFI